MSVDMKPVSGGIFKILVWANFEVGAFGPPLGASGGHIAADGFSGMGHSLLCGMCSFIWHWFQVVRRSCKLR